MGAPKVPGKEKPPELPDLMSKLEQKQAKKMKKEVVRRKKKRGLGKLYAEARRESHAGRKKERSDLLAAVKARVAKVARGQKRAIREKLTKEIRDRFKLFRETFPLYKKLKSKDHSVVRRLIENLKTWRLGLNI